LFVPVEGPYPDKNALQEISVSADISFYLTTSRYSYENQPFSSY
jgi:hypothetical protein